MSKIYEMRVYRCLPGRLPNLLKRFENTTLELWKKHGITYFLEWDSMADRETKWTAFMTDPAWISARAETEKDGQIVGNIVNQFLVPTAFSSVK
jgi:hypothetical protein